MVPSDSGSLPEYRGVTGTPRGSIGPTWALREREGSPRGVVARPPPRESEQDKEEWAAPPLPFPSPSPSYSLRWRKEKEGAESYLD